MPLAQWFRPPHRTLVVFLGLMSVLGAALGWLGWQALERDRLVERSQVQERVERAADQIVAALQRGLSDLDRLAAANPRSIAGSLPEGVVILHASRGSLTVLPESSLLFHPVSAGVSERAAAIFSAGERLEFRDNDPAAASEVFRQLSRAPRGEVRAGALARLGRTLRKTGRNEAALDAYNELAQLDATPALGLPAAVTAGEARCTVLESMGRMDDMRQEASRLAGVLWSGRYAMPRPAWEFHLDESRRRGADVRPTARQRQALALSSAAQWVYDRWSAGPMPAGRRALRLDDEPVLVSWTGGADQFDAALASGDYLLLVWSHASRGLPVQGGLVDADRKLAAGSAVKAGLRVLRTADATGLPWTLQVASADPAADSVAFAGRRRLLLGAFSVLALVLVAGSYFITRSIARELEVTRLQSEFVSTVSHEFRTPLTSIRQLAEMLAKGRVPTEELRQQSYDILSHESERLQRLIESLLDFGRIEAGVSGYRFERLDAVSLVDEVVSSFQETAAARGFGIDVRKPDAPAYVCADRDALGLAVRNLLDNAVKYSPECRTVWVETAAADRRLEIRVRDRGVGIPPAEQRSIFDRFVRGSAGRDAGIKGTGIGLTLARHIVDAHRGEIRLESLAGQGSTFTILLPLEDAG
jgi:signal transduction histidine kinase